MLYAARGEQTGNCSCQTYLFPLYFACGKPTRKVANGDYVMEFAAVITTMSWIPKCPDCDYLTMGTLQWPKL